MDIHEFCLYDDEFAGDEFADDAEGFGAVDDLDLHGADRAGYVAVPAEESVPASD
jgi:hypothetical protein